MTAEFTRWFSIDDDGQPVRPGWYDVLYSFEAHENIRNPGVYYWDGAVWRSDPEKGSLRFGNSHTNGEQWRGLTAPAP